MAWLQRAANRNNVEAQFALGQVLGGFYDHDGVTWLRRAAENGHLEATHHLGQQLLNAGSFYRKPVEALNWLRLAANAGYVPSQHSLGDLLLRGDVPHDPVEACVWYQLAAAAGDARCRAEAGSLARTLAPERRAEVESRVRDWLPTPLKQTSPAAELKLP